MSKHTHERISWKKEARLLPGYILLFAWVAFTAFVLLWIIAASLGETNDIMKGEVWQNLFSGDLHFENYADAWSSYNVSVYFINSLLYSVVGCVGTLAIAAPAAYVMSRFKFFGNRPIQLSYIVAMSVPAVMVILPLFSLASGLDLTNNRVLYIILVICLRVPFSVIYLMNFFQSLSRSYEEAAAIDGCSPMRTFWKIMLPLVQPALITVTVFNFLSIWNEYFIAMIFVSGDAKTSVGVGLMNMVNSMSYSGQYGGLFAAVIIVFLPTFILYLFLSDKVINGVTAGGVKG